MATRITFQGDPRAPGTDPKAVEVFGVVFPLGEAVEVSDEALAAKLARHSHFAVETVVTPAEFGAVADAPDLAPVVEMPIKRGPGRPRKNF